MDSDPQPPRVHIIGRKNSGKTTLVCELIRELAAQGARVGSIKHTPHQHDFDRPGKDSQLHRAAGAAVSGILSPGGYAAFWANPVPLTGDDRYAPLLRLYRDCDVVLVEGDTQTAAPKVEVWRQETGVAPFAVDGIEVQAVITDDPLECAVPCWSRTDVSAVAREILRIARGH